MRHDATLAEFLADRARHSSDIRLVADIWVGVLAAFAAWYWEPAGWILVAAAGTALAGYGLWAVADRELAGRRASGAAGSVQALLALRAAAATLAAAAAIVFVLRFLAVALGRMIS